MGIQILAPSHTCLVTLGMSLSWPFIHLRGHLPSLSWSPSAQRLSWRFNIKIQVWPVDQQHLHCLEAKNADFQVPSMSYWVGISNELSRRLVRMWAWEAVSRGGELVARLSGRSPGWSGHGWRLIPLYTRVSGDSTLMLRFTASMIVPFTVVTCLQKAESSQM